MKKIWLNIFIFFLIIAAGQLLAYKLFHVPSREEVILLFTAWIFYPILCSPIVGMYVLFIVLPFIPLIRRLYYLSFMRPKVDLLIMTGDIVMAIILLGLFFEMRRRFVELKKVKIWFRIILGYFLYLLFRTFVLNELPVNEAVLLFKNYGPPVLFFIIGMMYAHRTDHIQMLWNITIVIGIIAVAYGIKQLYFGYSHAEELWFSSISFTTLFIQGKARPFSVFQAPVAFADYMQLSCVAVLMSISDARNRMKVGLIVLLPLFFYGALITSVRSNWAGILALLVFWFTFFNVKGGKKRTMVFFGIIAVYLLYDYTNSIMGGSLGIDKAIAVTSKAGPDNEYMDMLVTDRTSALTDPLQEHSFQSRLYLWNLLLKTSIHPIYFFVGHGTGTIRADSLYFDYLGQYGYPGMIFIIWLIVVFVRKGLYVIDNSPDPRQVLHARAITSSTIVFAIISVTGTHLHGFPGDVYFWFFSGVLIKQAAEIKAGLEADGTRI
jgi:hypothetical protein